MNGDRLDQWTDKLLRYVRSGLPDLTNRQMAMVLLIYRTDGPHTVRGMAKVLAVTKPVVTRALTTLCKLGLARREIDTADRRSLYIRPTEAGTAFLSDLDGITSPLPNSGSARLAIGSNGKSRS